jgi:ligand-binding SRPBCC domain-containing protein
MAIHQINAETFVPATLDAVWDFISDPRNLQEITPKNMDFRILTPGLPEKIYPGLMIWYRLKLPGGVPAQWLTEITHVKDKSYFVDEQRKGPYALWHHEHFIREVEGGVEMKDLVTYRLPLGPLGELAGSLFVKKQLDGIFSFREEALRRIFPANGEKQSK